MNEYLEGLEPDSGKKGSSIVCELYDWAESIIVTLLGVMLLFAFIGQTINVDGDSMLPTLVDSERLICLKHGELKNGDIVVITRPGLRSNPLIKRVIAAGGQTIDIDFDNGVVYVDGIALVENYISEPTTLNYYGAEFPMTVPEGHVFVMGDNRNFSWDSRDPTVGFIDERYILGHVVYRVSPYNRIGRVDKT